MNYRNDIQEAKNFHRSRRAFIFYNNQVDFLPPKSPLSHFEYCQSKGLTKVFNNITRGYYLNGKLIFYKGDFIYDQKVIDEALKFIDTIAKEVKVNNFEIYFGQLPEQDFALDHHYGTYSKGKIIKAN
ncbi:hypothetical protein IJI91_03155 [Candidatus Saccharibacteria bacterium]|nr:hypothetical protein [Candidatus Saccharibacteria bacterium]